MQVKPGSCPEKVERSADGSAEEKEHKHHFYDSYELG